MKGRKKEHKWDYMGIDIETGAWYSYCDLCGKYRYEVGGSGWRPMTKKQYYARYEDGKVEFR